MRKAEKTTMARKLFLNLAVKDLKTSMEFFSKLGFEFNKQFTDDKAASMVVSDDAYVMLVTHPFFKTFTKRDIADSNKSTEAITAYSVDSKAEVDKAYETAVANGGALANDPQDHGFMYTKSFYDPDGHLWECFWMDPSFVKKSS